MCSDRSFVPYYCANSSLFSLLNPPLYLLFQLRPVIPATGQAETVCGFSETWATLGPVCTDRQACPAHSTCLSHSSDSEDPSSTRPPLTPTRSTGWLLKFPSPRITSPSYLPAHNLNSSPSSVPALMCTGPYFSTQHCEDKDCFLASYLQTWQRAGCVPCTSHAASHKWCTVFYWLFPLNSYTPTQNLWKVPKDTTYRTLNKVILPPKATFPSKGHLPGWWLFSNTDARAWFGASAPKWPSILPPSLFSAVSCPSTFPLHSSALHHIPYMHNCHPPSLSTPHQIALKAVFYIATGKHLSKIKNISHHSSP